MRSPEVGSRERVRPSRRIRKDYKKMELIPKFSESQQCNRMHSKKKKGKGKKNGKQEEFGLSSQKQFKENVLKRCLDLGDLVPEAVISTLNKSGGIPDIQKIIMKFPSQNEYSESIGSVIKASQVQVDAVKELVGVNCNQSLNNYLSQTQLRRQEQCDENSRGSHNFSLMSSEKKKLKEQKEKALAIQKDTIETLKQNLHYKINPQFIKSELKKELKSIKNNQNDHDSSFHLERTISITHNQQGGDKVKQQQINEKQRGDLDTIKESKLCEQSQEQQAEGQGIIPSQQYSSQRKQSTPTNGSIVNTAANTPSGSHYSPSRTQSYHQKSQIYHQNHAVCQQPEMVSILQPEQSIYLIHKPMEMLHNPLLNLGLRENSDFYYQGGGMNYYGGTEFIQQDGYSFNQNCYPFFPQMMKDAPREYHLECHHIEESTRIDNGGENQERACTFPEKTRMQDYFDTTAHNSSFSSIFFSSSSMQERQGGDLCEILGDNEEVESFFNFPKRIDASPSRHLDNIEDVQIHEEDNFQRQNLTDFS